MPRDRKLRSLPRLAHASLRKVSGLGPHLRANITPSEYPIEWAESPHAAVRFVHATASLIDIEAPPGLYCGCGPPGCCSPVVELEWVIPARRLSCAHWLGRFWSRY